MSVLIDRQSPKAGAFAAFRPIAAEFVRRVKAFGASLTRRKQVRALGHLDDRMLADMGLTRADVAEASRWSLWGDDGDRLTAVAEERRLASRRY